MRIRENSFAKQQPTFAALEQNGSMGLAYLHLMVSQRLAKNQDQVGNGHVNHVKVVANIKYHEPPPRVAQRIGSSLFVGR